MKSVIPKEVRRTVRKLGARVGVMRDWDTHFEERANEVGKECAASWYNEVYATSESYRAHYSQSEYYFLWAVIADRILSDNFQRVLDIGCGPGQFAALLADQKLEHYTGLDFSEQAIELAKNAAPGYDFLVANAHESDVFNTVEHDLIVCTEVLEHIKEDLELVSRFPKDKRVICTVPNFPFSSHVRHFESAEEVEQRYSRFFDLFSVITLHGVRNPEERFFLFDGLRNKLKFN